MFNIPWLHVKYTFNVVQNTLMYIKSIGTSQEVTKLQLILWLNEHKGLFFGEKPKSYSISKDVQFSSSHYNHTNSNKIKKMVTNCKNDKR
jgi:hypothetical protein